MGAKAKAILAGGLVLGVGAAVTLAAWTDQEWAIGNFGTGQFGIEGSIDGTDFTSHATEAGAAQLSFSAETPTDLTPTDVVYESFAVRLEQNSTRQAEVDITQHDDDAIAGTSAAFRLTTSLDCDADAFVAGTADTSFTLGETDDVQYICFEVTADSEEALAKGATGSFTWQFEAESGEAITP
ncbi:MAG: hypothetical protein GX862_08575 [Leucobacter sp.]|nr:hypothetical protein [Leucobacter sp.]